MFKIRTMDELVEQFNKEDAIWKEKLYLLYNMNEYIIKRHVNIYEDQPFDEFMYYIDLGICIIKRMNKLDSDHKKFLLRWERKARRCVYLNILKNLLGA